MSQHWIHTFIEASLGDFEVTPEIDRRLSRLALDAGTSNAARDELFVLLAAKIERFARRFRYWSLAPWEYDDVLQESYLIFLDTVRRWRPRYVDNEPVGYLYYFLAVFRLWLSQRVSQMTGRGRPAIYALPDDQDAIPDSGSCESDAVVTTIVGDVRAKLGEQAGEILYLRLATGKSVTEIARATGIPRRTAYRRWATITAFTRREWLEEQAGA
jgi:DNA-directed RNA polymerase specialized sigma24 family protein